MQFLKNLAKYFLKDEISILEKNINDLKLQLDGLKQTTLKNFSSDHDKVEQNDFAPSSIRLYNVDSPNSEPVEIALSDDSIWNESNFVQVVDKPKTAPTKSTNQYYEIVRAAVQKPLFKTRSEKENYDKTLQESIFQMHKPLENAKTV